MTKPTICLAAAALPLVLGGCTHIGASTIARDRFDYSSAITESWKRQTLLNIVKLRYLDPPIFVDVGQIISGYTLETALSGGGAVSSDPAGSALGGTSASLGGSVRYTDRPTITYLPMTGNKFMRALMTPLSPETLFQTIVGGWPADSILVATVNTINGLDNQHASLQGSTPADEKFLRVLRLLREVQLSGAMGLRVRKGDTPGAASNLLVIRRQQVAPETAAKSKELRELLGLDPDAESFSLVFGATAESNTEVAMVTRSVLHILIAMSMGVDVPEADVQEGRAVPGPAPAEVASNLLHVHSGDSAPADAYIAVAYRDHYYWIDDQDLRSKRAFAFMMMLFTMSDPSSADNLPVVTIPA